MSERRVKASMGSIRKQVESIKKKKLAAKKVVNLGDFRDLKKGLDQPSVLVVDDDEIMRNAIKRILEGDGFHVVVAEDGMEVSKVLETTKLDLILLDVNLPWVDGFELCGLIKSHQSLSHVPLIMVSAQKAESDVQRGFDCGANDYITKPFDIDLMLSRIHKALDRTS